MPTIVAQISDPHLLPGADGDGRAAGLRAAVAAVRALDPAPAAVLLTGDVADDGSSAAYARAGELLAPLPMPVHAVPGNHDDPAALAAALGPARFDATYGGLRLLGLDSSRRGTDAGRVDGDDRAWLAARLREAPATPTLLAVHHPPILTGIGDMDGVALPPGDRAAVAALAAEHRQLGPIASGHAHRAATGAAGACPVVIAPSTYAQLRLDLREHRPGTFALADEPPGFLLHVLIDGAVVSHVQPLAAVPPPASLA